MTELGEFREYTNPDKPWRALPRDTSAECSLDYSHHNKAARITEWAGGQKKKGPETRMRDTE
jgi:hypothetical protein